jgi:hypothetical protein
VLLKEYKLLYCRGREEGTWGSEHLQWAVTSVEMHQWDG